MIKITMKRSKIKVPTWKVDSAEAQKIIEDGAIPMIKERTKRGRDIFDRPFAPYRPSYRAALDLAGQPTNADLLLTGQMLDSLKIVGRKKSKNGFGFDVKPAHIKHRNVYMAPPWVVNNDKAKERWKAKYAGLVETGKRGAYLDEIGRYLHEGTPKMNARPFLGLSPSDVEKIRRKIADSVFFKLG